MVKKIFILGVIVIMALGLFAGCQNGKPTETAQSGAYFAVGKGNEFAVVYEDKLTLRWDFGNNRYDVFRFSRDGDSYLGENVRAKVSVKFAGDNLTIILTSTSGYTVKNKKIKLKLSGSIGLSEEAPIQLDGPNIPADSTGIAWKVEELIDGLGAVPLGSNALYSSGILGAGIEIKCAGEEDFDLQNIRNYIPEPACFFYVHFPDLHLTQGTYAMRIMHLGGPFVQNEKVRLSLNSEAIYFNVTVDAEGNVTKVEKIEQ